MIEEQCQNKAESHFGCMNVISDSPSHTEIQGNNGLSKAWSSLYYFTSFLQRKMKQPINTFVAKHTLAAWITTDLL